MASAAHWPPSRFGYSQFARQGWERLDCSAQQNPVRLGPRRALNEDACRRSSGQMRNMEIAVPVSFCVGHSTGVLPPEEASKSRPLFLAGRPLPSSHAADGCARHTSGLVFPDKQGPCRWPKILRNLILLPFDIASPSESHHLRLLESVCFAGTWFFKNRGNAGGCRNIPNDSSDQLELALAK